MSAFDPKRTLLFSRPTPSGLLAWFDTMPYPEPRGHKYAYRAISRTRSNFRLSNCRAWDTNIHGYNSAFGAVARQTVKPILDAANVKHGKRVLDICCGPGMLAADMTFCGAYVG